MWLVHAAKVDLPKLDLSPTPTAGLTTPRGVRRAQSSLSVIICIKMFSCSEFGSMEVRKDGDDYDARYHFVTSSTSLLDACYPRLVLGQLLQATTFVITNAANSLPTHKR